MQKISRGESEFLKIKYARINRIYYCIITVETQALCDAGNVIRPMALEMGNKMVVNPLAPALCT